MAKRKVNKSIKKFGLIISFALAVVVIAMAFLPFVKNGDTVYSGFELAFGKVIKTKVGIIETTLGTINFSILGVLALVIPLVAVVVCYFVLNKNVKLNALVLFVAFAFSAVMFFIFPQITSFTDSVFETTKSFAELEYSLGVGAIIAGVLSALGALFQAARVVMK